MDCWFCSLREAEENHVLAVEMYGEVNTEESDAQTNVAYKVRHIRMPRCADCHSRHKIALNLRILTVFWGIVLLAAILTAVFRWTADWIWALVMGFSFGLLLGSLAAHALTLRKIHSVGMAKVVYPEIKNLKEMNYHFGKHPKGQMHETE